MTNQEVLEDIALDSSIYIYHHPLLYTKACIVEMYGVFNIALDIVQIDSPQEETIILHMNQVTL